MKRISRVTLRYLVAAAPFCGVLTFAPPAAAVPAQNPKTKSSASPLNATASRQLFQEIRFGSPSLDRIRALLAQGADVNVRNPDTGRDDATILMWAAYRRNSDWVALLLERGANPNAHNKSGETPLGQASIFGDVTMVKLFLKRGAKITQPGGGTALSFAASSQNRPVVQYLLSLPARSAAGRAVRADLNNALVAACGPAENITRFAQDNPARYMSQRIAFAEYLMGQGAKTNDRTGNSPALVSALWSAPLVKRLLMARANPNSYDENGTPALIAALNDEVDTECFALLLKSDAKPDTEDKKGWTALHFAAENGDTARVQLLLVHKANINKRTKSGDTPLALALHAKNEKVADLLRARGG